MHPAAEFSFVILIYDDEQVVAWARIQPKLPPKLCRVHINFDLSPVPAEEMINCTSQNKNSKNYRSDVIHKITHSNPTLFQSYTLLILHSWAIIWSQHNLKKMFAGIPQGPLDTSPDIIRIIQKRVSVC